MTTRIKVITELTSPLKGFRYLIRFKPKLSDKELEIVSEWCQENCNGYYQIKEIGALFDNKHDAFAFRLAW